MFTQVTAELACTGQAIEQTKDVAGNVVQGSPLAELLFNVGEKGMDGADAVGSRLGSCVEIALIGLCQNPGVVVSHAAQHYAIDVLQVFCVLLVRGDAAIKDDLQLCKNPVQRIQ